MMRIGPCATISGTAFLLALAAIPRLARSARGWVDSPQVGVLKVHGRPVPFVGGLGMLLAGLPAFALAISNDKHIAVPMAAVLIPALSVTLLGLRDDCAGLSPQVRLVAQFVAGATLAVLGIGSGAIDLHGLDHWGIAARHATVLLVAFYVVGAINAFNMQDGLDGLAGGLALISCVGCGLAGAALGQGLVVSLACALGGSIAAFLAYNLPPASIFMGDSGSYFLGLMIAAMAVILTAAAATPRGLLGGVLLVGFPVVDATIAVVRRVGRGVSPFRGDRSHVYDWLVRRGLSTWEVDLACYLLHGVSVAAGVRLLQA